MSEQICLRRCLLVGHGAGAGGDQTPAAYKRGCVDLNFMCVLHRPSKQPLMVRTFLKVYMELGSYFLFLQEQIKDIIIIILTPPPELQHIQTYEKEKEKLKLA